MVIAHIHGAEKIYLDACKDLECGVFCWEGRAAGTSIPEARRRTPKRLCRRNRQSKRNADSVKYN